MSRGWETQTKKGKSKNSKQTQQKSHKTAQATTKNQGKVDGWSVCNVSKGCKRLLGLLQPSSHQTQRNKKLTSSGFKYQPICALLAPTRIKSSQNSSNGPNSGSGKLSQNRLRSKGPS